MGPGNGAGIYYAVHNISEPRVTQQHHSATEWQLCIYSVLLQSCTNDVSGQSCAQALPYANKILTVSDKTLGDGLGRRLVSGKNGNDPTCFFLSR